MWIYLLRHGIAEDPSLGSADEDRRLTDEGVERLTRAGKTWQKLMVAPELVLTSPYRRARETAAMFAKAVGYGGELRDEAKLVPHGRTDETLVLLEGLLLAQTASVALIGHEPNLGYLLGSLLTGHSHLSMPLKRGMLVGLETESTTNVICGLRFSMTQRIAAQLG
ncbi:MAG: phosphohistidine phosphatase [Planctomycetota bacterium]|jgi:phosphohistidine phosphatase